jgi:hypothetical protein
LDLVRIEGRLPEGVLVLKNKPAEDEAKPVGRGVNDSVRVPPTPPIPLGVAVAPPPPIANDALGNTGVGVGTPPEGVGKRAEEVTVGMEGEVEEGETEPTPEDTLGQVEEEGEGRDEGVVEGESDGFGVKGEL